MSRTFPSKATQKRCIDDRRRWLVAVTLVFSAIGPAAKSGAADGWGGSIGVTSDYLVRGVSRSADDPSVQGDFHFTSLSGFIAGAFASSAKINPGDGTGAEVGAFVGFTWRASENWRLKTLLNQYAYAGARDSDNYDYDELVLDASYEDWLGLSVEYSPNFRRYVRYHGLVRAASTSAELNLQHPIYKKLFLTGGVGYSYQSGPNAGGYVYGSVGAACDLSPFTLAVSYIDTSEEAKSLFYEQVPSGQWAGTVIWRFK